MNSPAESRRNFSLGHGCACLAISFVCFRLSFHSGRQKEGTSEAEVYKALSAAKPQIPP